MVFSWYSVLEPVKGGLVCAASGPDADRVEIRMEIAWRFGAQLLDPAATGPGCYTPASAMVTQ